MATRYRRLGSTLLLTTVATTTASAGGWVVITVQDLPDHARLEAP